MAEQEENPAANDEHLPKTNYRFFVGGNDLEMTEIRKLLTENGIRMFDNNLGWGAKASAYSKQIADTIKKGEVPVLIELDQDVKLPKDANFIVVDHHGERSQEPASILQICKLLNIETTRRIELIAANDSGWIPKLRAIGAKDEEIKAIREEDRKAQGFDDELERQSEELTKTAQILPELGLAIVDQLPISRFAGIKDRIALEKGIFNIVSIANPEHKGQNGEMEFQGDGLICKKLADQYQGWSGGDGLGKRGGVSFWGGNPDKPDEIIDSIKKSIVGAGPIKDISERKIVVGEVVLKEQRIPRVKGIVKKIDKDRGFGFIHQEGGKDVFFHIDDLELDTLTEKFKEGKLTGTEVVYMVYERGKKGPKAVGVLTSDVWDQMQADQKQSEPNQQKRMREREKLIKSIKDLLDSESLSLPDDIRKALSVRTFVYEFAHGGWGATLNEVFLGQPRDHQDRTCLFIGGNVALLLNEEHYWPPRLTHKKGYKPESVTMKTIDLNKVKEILEQEKVIFPKREKLKARIKAIKEASDKRINISYSERAKKGSPYYFVTLNSYETNDGDAIYFPAGVGIDSCTSLSYDGKVYQLEEEDLSHLEQILEQRFPKS